MICNKDIINFSHKTKLRKKCLISLKISLQHKFLTLLRIVPGEEGCRFLPLGNKIHFYFVGNITAFCILADSKDEGIH